MPTRHAARKLYADEHQSRGDGGDKPIATKTPFARLTPAVAASIFAFYVDAAVANIEVICTEIAGEPQVAAVHLSEAIQYRRLDRSL